MSWRYQPVFVEQDGERMYSLCEAFFDDDGALTSWTVAEAVPAGGEDLEALTADLARMLVDAYSWKAVRFSDMRVGMAFEKRITMEARRDVADYIEEVKETFKRQIPPTPN